MCHHFILCRLDIATPDGGENGLVLVADPALTWKAAKNLSRRTSG
ncbi:MAG: hypothetical protein WKF28_05150 [Rubrobacteraceae bacterium]